MRTSITPNKDTFHLVNVRNKQMEAGLPLLEFRYTEMKILVENLMI